jgi:hypothetical protein
MARYIDADALLSRLPNDLPYKASVKRVLMQAPDVDVAPKSEWISVEDRLPEIEGVYLAYTTRRTIEVAHFYPYYVNGKPQFDYWITHWMPLPEPPKMKGGE